MILVDFDEDGILEFSEISNYYKGLVGVKDEDLYVVAKEGYRALTAVRKIFFRLFPIISISQKIFSIFFLTLEKIGIDEKVICYHNISN